MLCQQPFCLSQLLLRNRHSSVASNHKPALSLAESLGQLGISSRIGGAHSLVWASQVAHW